MTGFISGLCQYCPLNPEGREEIIQLLLLLSVLGYHVLQRNILGYSVEKMYIGFFIQLVLYKIKLFVYCFLTLLQKSPCKKIQNKIDLKNYTMGVFVGFSLTEYKCV